MASSTEDYLDSLLRQAMGIPDPEPEKKPEPDTSHLQREDVLAMADGLTGSNSAILGNAYDHNASFTNEGEIETTVAAPAAAAEPVPEGIENTIPEADMPDPDAPPVADIVPNVDIMSTVDTVPDVSNIIPEDNSITEASIPNGPVVEHDGNLDIIPEPEMMAEIEMPAIEEPVIEEPVAETPVVQEPVIDETAVEEPAVEEPVIEEPAAEEPVIEEPAVEEPVVEEPAAPTMSIDDLDPNNSTQALDADTIAALFAGANAEEPVTEEPVAEEPVIEEPSVEEPVVEEAAAEEPVIEEPVAEEPAAPTMSIDDLDPNNSMQALDADTIAALFAGANAADMPEGESAAEEEPAPVEEPVAEEEPAPVEESVAEEEPASEEEPVAEEDAAVADPDILDGGADAELEELNSVLEDTDDTPLMPDQEISDLLSTLGELSGETAEEPEEISEGESLADETAVDEALEEPASEDGGSDVDLGGLDVFDTDLSAMLDDVTNSLDSENEGGDAASSEDTDLNDLLGAFGDDSGELSDIGDLLNKDENSELVDPNTETAEALFASDSEEEIFNIDNLIDEEENASGKKKKKKKFSLFGKKKKKSDNIEVIGGDEEMLIDPELLDIPDESEIKSKKPGFFAALFAKLFEEVGEEESAASGIEQSAVEIAQEGAAENEAILSELEEEGAGEDKKKKKKEKKKKEKKDKKAKEGGEEGGEGEGEEGAEDSKKKKKKEKKKKEKLPEIPGKRLPRKKVVAISLFCITIGIVITFLAFMIPYSQDIKKAKKFYTTGEYQKTYEYMRGHKLTSEDQLLYNRTTTLLRIKRPYDSYQNYMKMGLRMEALNALVQGVQMIDRYAEDAATLGIIDKYSKQSRLIYDELYNTFGVTVDKARSWIELEGSPEYTHALYEALRDKSGIREEQSGLPEDPEAADDSVINAEENDL